MLVRMLMGIAQNFGKHMSVRLSLPISGVLTGTPIYTQTKIMRKAPKHVHEHIYYRILATFISVLMSIHTLIVLIYTRNSRMLISRLMSILHDFGTYVSVLMRIPKSSMLKHEHAQSYVHEDHTVSR